MGGYAASLCYFQPLHSCFRAQFYRDTAYGQWRAGAHYHRQEHQVDTHLDQRGTFHDHTLFDDADYHRYSTHTRTSSVSMSSPAWTSGNPPHPDGHRSNKNRARHPSRSASAKLAIPPRILHVLKLCSAQLSVLTLVPRYQAVPRLVGSKRETRRERSHCVLSELVYIILPREFRMLGQGDLRERHVAEQIPCDSMRVRCRVTNQVLPNVCRFCHSGCH
jgi:hypothetical protein